MSFRFPLLALLLLSTAAHAQTPKQEFRGAWIATVANLDWPSCTSCSPDVQKEQLLRILDGLQGAGVNAAVFQVRTEADALYASPYEPWSYWLTGAQGTAPEPAYDPLAFAVEAAHARGMELHAWINPYRADRGSSYPKAADHVTNAHPEWILSFSDGIKILDPGLPDVRDHVARVVGDIVRRYDIDGLHYDDYFYPYSGTRNEDSATFAAHSRGFTDVGDWRRDNVNLLVAQIQDTVQTLKPEVAHGVSPFGIWRSGTPTGTSGLDAYSVIYADAVAWLDAQTIDYLAPQLYWPSDRSFDTNGDGVPDTFNEQRFTTLAAWWGSVRNDRHIYPGLAAYRAGGRGFDPGEIPTQIRYTRGRSDIDGTIFFRANYGVLANNQGLEDSLRTDLYRRPALTPTMNWKSLDAPGAPGGLQASFPNGGEDGMVDLQWTPPAEGDAEARFFAVYRIPSAEAGDLGAAMAGSQHLIAVTGEPMASDRTPGGDLYTYVVTSVSHNSVESAPSNAVTVQGDVAREDGPDRVFALGTPRPNPATSQATIGFTLRQPTRVTLRVMDVLGREVARLLTEEPLAATAHTVDWRPAAASSGTYLVVLEADGQRATRTLTVIR